jgi:uncharacterized protein (TIGR00299 family) protein
VDGYRLETRKVVKNGISALDVDISVTKHQPHRHLSDIQTLLQTSTLPDPVVRQSLAVFQAIAVAEAQVHGVTVEAVHFHEVGAVDTIIDIVGVISVLHYLQVEQVIVSPLPLGNGWVQCAHGLLPVPAPATLELVRGLPLAATDIQAELVTPTGAALVRTLATGFGPLPAIQVTGTGYGAGKKELSHPNLLRAVLGDQPYSTVSCPAGLETEQIMVMETTIDDMNPEFYQHLWEELFAAGAIEVYLTPVFMKKQRPGNLLTVICPETKQAAVTQTILAETTSLGLRYRREERVTAPRQLLTVATSYGPVRIKYSQWSHPATGQSYYNLAPEYEDCRAIAQAQRVPLKHVYDQAQKMALAQLPQVP